MTIFKSAWQANYDSLALQKLPEETVVRDLVYKESLHGRKPIEKNGDNNPLYKTAVSR